AITHSTSARTVGSEEIWSCAAHFQTTFFSGEHATTHVRGFGCHRNSRKPCTQHAGQPSKIVIASWRPTRQELVVIWRAPADITGYSKFKITLQDADDKQLFSEEYGRGVRSVMLILDSKDSLKEAVCSIHDRIGEA